MKESYPFGSRSRTRILLALSSLEASYPRELARRLESPIFAVRKALEGLQRDGLVTSRLVGRTRVYTLDPSYLAYKELAAYLARLARPQEIQSRPQFPEAPVSMTDLSAARPPAAPPASPSPPGSPAFPAPRRGSDPDDGWRNW